jgi:formylglycine-generating enzyme required for sulfatase activity
MGDSPSKFSGCDNCPVEQVSWDDIQTYLQKLNAKTGKQYRLPTEAEWEYACYGGNKTEYCGGNDADLVAWYEGNSGNKTQPVGQKQSNGYGLYDMSGNVWEWTSTKVRGGAWNYYKRGLRAADRDPNPPYPNGNIGFRVVVSAFP